MKPTEIRHCDAWDGQVGDLAWRVMYQFDAEGDLWAPLSIPFNTEAEARAAELILRGQDCPTNEEIRATLLEQRLDEVERHLHAKANAGINISDLVDAPLSERGFGT